MWTAVAILAIFLIFAFLMITQRMSSVLSLIFMAILIPVVAGVPFTGSEGILQKVVEGGAIRLATAIAAVIFGAWLGQLMVQTGISHSMIAKAAELGGDKPMGVALALGVVVAILFTAVGHLGAVIMVGTIVLPILMSVGIDRHKAATIFLISMATGIAMNLSNWQTYASIANVEIGVIQQFGVIQLVITGAVAVVYIVLQTRRVSSEWAVGGTPPATGSSPTKVEAKHVPALSLLTPLVPLVLVLGFKWPIVPSMLAGILYGAVTVDFRNSPANLTRSVIDGLRETAPAISLMVAIGMVLNAVFLPQVAEAMGGLLRSIIPSSPVGYVLFFALLAPLALYRGPLNMWGLGSGIVGLIISLGILSPQAAMAAFMSTERVQIAGDPTNTHNVWTADFTKIDVNAITRRLLPFLWIVAAISALIAGILYV
ncbi:C4-dicarboxylate ABC transporter [Limnochorda pilosa]|uniref:C4-dicarboxylate ABC transporter n=1 Tax=Limnochorda pilosa TaxID=1555112 RepID=A0A0K2SJU4_LIMPI|nr:C4-dicarboxylate ABC transporter [Limnochorda pilosa]BAS27365.1 C4-dicarboxylate ABC transporter [Limnochorda pilosa]